MCISILRPNQGKLTDNNSDSGLCSYVEPYRSLQWRRKIPQNASKRLKTQQNAAKRCEMPQKAAICRKTQQMRLWSSPICCKTPQNDAKRIKCTWGCRQFTAKRRNNSNYIRDSVSQDSNDQKSNHENGKENESEEGCMEICKEEATGSGNQQFRGQFLNWTCSYKFWSIRLRHCLSIDCGSIHLRHCLTIDCGSWCSSSC